MALLLLTLLGMVLVVGVTVIWLADPLQWRAPSEVSTEDRAALSEEDMAAIEAARSHETARKVAALGVGIGLPLSAHVGLAVIEAAWEGLFSGRFELLAKLMSLPGLLFTFVFALGLGLVVYLSIGGGKSPPARRVSNTGEKEPTQR